MEMVSVDLMTLDLAVAVLRAGTHRMEALVTAMWKKCAFRRVLRGEFWKVRPIRPK